MSSSHPRKSAEEMNEETRRVWDENAEFWDDYMGEGNSFQRILIGPTTESLLDLRRGELVLDIGCGNGNFARRMAQLGARVIATDFSEKFLERARLKSAEYGDRLEYRLIDATDEAQLMSLGEGRFDAAVSTMAMMDIVVIEPLAAALGRLVKPGGRFVFSVMHPCFNSGNIIKVIEQTDSGGVLTTVRSIKLERYMTPYPAKGIGVVGQPAAQYYFHRPLSDYFNPFFGAGFVMDGLAERAFAGEVEDQRPLSWVNFTEFPPVLVVRMRRRET